MSDPTTRIKIHIDITSLNHTLSFQKVLLGHLSIASGDKVYVGGETEETVLGGWGTTCESREWDLLENQLTINLEDICLGFHHSATIEYCREILVEEGWEITEDDFLTTPSFANPG